MDSIPKYQTTLDGINSDMLHGFFVGWPKHPDLERHLKLLQNSEHKVVALADGRVIGFVTAISDGVLAAYIPLLEVLPEYQGKGVGGELVRRLLVELNGLYMVDLLCDPELQPFYERLGMEKAVGMMHRNYSAQEGGNK